MFVKLLLQFLLWVSPIWVTPQTTVVQPSIPLGTNPLNVDESKIVAYLKDNPTATYNSNVVFVDKDEDYKLAHLMGKSVVDVRYRERPVVSETDSAEEVQDKINKIKSATSIESDEVALALLGNMTETVKVSD
mgnify:CR=1 FL=1|jgi:hypothetical protein